MTLYHSDVDDGVNGDEGVEQIIENHPDYAEFDEEGRLVLTLDDLQREEKRKSLLFAAAAAIEASDEYDLATEPEVEWVGGE
ncbi:hypothetical protein SAMN06269185_3272 [Natronoarchaeum philippinense]|uniref:Uncharacterized protein n=1 Tax=Natronoarchaeum philippinense TaxID=558529 RepID=A0A285PE71_NATPI|nr:hypothetical protein [Natronoarchaeum philippinense]SNZ18161.1 hypothetical protein SAMN06269185_3272 [Natronoarchaeum philippinense]